MDYTFILSEFDTTINPLRTADNDNWDKDSITNLIISRLYGEDE